MRSDTSERNICGADSRLRRIGDAFGDAIVVLRPDNTICYWNPAAASLFDYSADEILEKNISTIFPGQQRAWARKISDGSALTLEAEGLCKDGTRIPLVITVSWLESETRPLVLMVIEDRSHEKEVEERECQHLRDLQFLSAASMHFVEFKEDEIYDYIGEEIRTQVPCSVVVIASYDAASNRYTVRTISGDGMVLGKIMKILREWIYDMRFPSRSAIESGQIPGTFQKLGNDIHYLTSGNIPESVCRLIEKVYPIKCIYTMSIARNGRLFGNVSVVVTEEVAPERLDVLQTFVNLAAVAFHRKHAEETVLEEKERLSVTLASIGDGVIATDTDGRIVLINSVAASLTGWTETEAIARPLGDVLRLADPSTHSPLPSPVPCREGDPVECLLLSRSGSGCPVSYSSAPIRGGADRIFGNVLIIRDITLGKKIEEERMKAEKLGSLGVLAGGISHDFNNILTAILGNITLAKGDLAPGTFAFERINEAERGIERAKEITAQLLAFSTGGAPVRSLTALPGYIGDVVESTLSGSNVRCVLSFDDDLRPVHIDTRQFSSVIRNLVVNAVQAMPGGGLIRIRAENVVLPEGNAAMLPEGDYVRIRVEDEGPGIPPDLLSGIFDPYVAMKKGGDGLGLAAARTIIQNHGGRITAESPRGGGAVFVILLPPAGYLDPGGEESGFDAGTRPAGPGRILLMDDDDGILEVAGILIQRLGYGVVTASCGEEVVECYRHAMAGGRPFDAVILDLTVPKGMGGVETVGVLRTMDSRVRAIVSSGYSAKPVMAEYEKYGFCAVLRKPYTGAELADVLNRAIHPDEKINGHTGLSSRTQ
ncbi:MAG: PAS domain S-box protein [Methanofollis sp.]|uniref:PAS domain-containing protein n=1 Tax=Methanofollis sp. TaxID=2052835 RepID=UPI002628C7B3|nr:PAS domain-containing protein [Methanofollis sp.]MDD4255790.1 PAS domain S-box protein [Methanofollis sp.]